MRRRYFQSNASKVAFLLDTLVVPLSLLAALAIRSQFKDFLVSLSGALVIFSLTLVFRVLSLLIFDAYTLSFATFTNADMQRIIRINTLPTLLLILMRLISPIQIIRMPFSMIAIEFVTTTLAFIIIRLIMHNHLVATSRVLGYRRRILVWSEIDDFSRNVLSKDELCRSDRIEIVGILNDNPLFWQTEFKGFRVLGDETTLRGILATDDRISMLCFVAPEELTKRRVKALLLLVEELNLQIGLIRDGILESITPDEFLRIAAGTEDSAEPRSEERS